tara:strand:- start:2613 stop:2783 length:171 start_codon:yes stop_codon:yes gene_type:complete
MEDGNVKEKVRFYQNEIEKNFTQYCKEDKRLRNLLKENMDKINPEYLPNPIHPAER